MIIGSPVSSNSDDTDETKPMKKEELENPDKARSTKLESVRKKRTQAIKKTKILSKEEMAEAQIRKKQSYLKRRPKF